MCARCDAASATELGTPLPQLHVHSTLQHPQSRRRARAVVSIIKLAIEAGKANPAPPVGPALGAAGLNIMEFCKAYNAATQDKMGDVIPVDISVMDVRRPPHRSCMRRSACVARARSVCAVHYGPPRRRTGRSRSS